MTERTELAPATAAPVAATSTHDQASGGNAERRAARASRANRSTVAPAVDIYEDATGITLLADLPGVSKDRLELKVESNHILIEGEAQVSVPEGFKLLHAESREPVYRRAFALGPELDKERIDANLKDGVLTVRIPRLAQAQPRRIQVTTA